MANKIILDQQRIHTPMERYTTDAQEMYTLYIPAGTLDYNSRLRITTSVGRVFDLSDVCPDSELICCTDDTAPVPQALTETDMWEIDTANYRFSWGYVGTGREMYILRVFATCGGGNGYYDDCSDLLHIIDGVVTSVNHLRPAIDHTPAVNCSIGHSDEHCFAFEVGNDLYYHSVPNQTRVIFSAVFGDGGMSSPIWTKYSSNIYVVMNQTTKRVRVFNATSGGTTDFTDSLSSYTTIESVQANATYFYALVHTAGNDKLVRMSVSDLDTVEEIVDLGAANFYAFYVVNDSLVYFVKNVTNALVIGVYAWDGTDFYAVDTSISITSLTRIDDGRNGLHFIDRELFYGEDVDNNNGNGNICIIGVPCVE